MINELTKEQQDKLAVYREKWLGIGLCTKRADREKCEQYAKDIYKVAGLDEPKIFIWMDGPNHGAYAAAMLADSKFGPSVGAQVGAQVRAQVYRCGYGSHDANWLGFYEFFLNELGIKDAEKLSIER